MIRDKATSPAIINIKRSICTEESLSLGYGYLGQSLVFLWYNAEGEVISFGNIAEWRKFLANSYWKQNGEISVDATNLYLEQAEYFAMVENWKPELTSGLIHTLPVSDRQKMLVKKFARCIESFYSKNSKDFGNGKFCPAQEFWANFSTLGGLFMVSSSIQPHVIDDNGTVKMHWEHWGEVYNLCKAPK